MMAFGAVLCLIPFDTLDEAIDIVNAAPEGLATGVFTNRLNDAFRAARHLEVGACISMKFRSHAWT
tara:strand:- start:355 stop:552 length:198 start_codon:yes stop_codon:yes gene_type:complete